MRSERPPSEEASTIATRSTTKLMALEHWKLLSSIVLLSLLAVLGSIITASLICRNLSVISENFKVEVEEWKKSTIYLHKNMTDLILEFRAKRDAFQNDFQRGFHESIQSPNTLLRMSNFMVSHEHPRPIAQPPTATPNGFPQGGNLMLGHHGARFNFEVPIRPDFQPPPMHPVFASNQFTPSRNSNSQQNFFNAHANAPAPYMMEMNEECESGPTGQPGVSGMDGLPGQPGADGRPGKDAKPLSGDSFLFNPYGGQGCIVCPTGPPGRQGVSGSKGVPGRKGRSGPAGSPGIHGTPSKGPGPTGLPGSPGRDGRSGGKGPPGKTAFKGKGHTGIQGQRGLTGPAGKRGDHGTTISKTGSRGSRGPTGFRGVPGNQGLHGYPGNSGQSGIGGNDAHYCPCPQKEATSYDRNHNPTPYAQQGRFTHETPVYNDIHNRIPEVAPFVPQNYGQGIQVPWPQGWKNRK